MKDIPGFEGRYAATEDGRIWSRPSRTYLRGHFLKPFKNSRGYLTVVLSKGPAHYNWRVHRLVALTFLPNPRNLPFVHHKNAVRHDNRVENLEWVTPQQNVDYMQKLCGERNPKAVLNECLIREMQLGRQAGMTYDEIAVKFRVNRATAHQALTGQTWQHLAA